MFTFQAVYPVKTSKEAARLMLQSALEERFELKWHSDKQTLEVYEMVAAPGGLHLTEEEAPEKQKRIEVKGQPSSFVMSYAGRFAAVAISLDNLGVWVAQKASLDIPVLNRTGLSGLYKFDLHWPPDEDSETSGTGMIGALKRQSGLILRKQKVPVDVLVVDAARQTPTAN